MVIGRLILERPARLVNNYFILGRYKQINRQTYVIDN